MSDLDRQIEQLRRCEYLKESEVKALCMRAQEILIDESNVQRVDAPLTVSFFYWDRITTFFYWVLMRCLSLTVHDSIVPVPFLWAETNVFTTAF